MRKVIATGNTCRPYLVEATAQTNKKSRDSRRYPPSLATPGLEETTASAVSGEKDGKKGGGRSRDKDLLRLAPPQAHVQL